MSYIVFQRLKKKLLFFVLAHNNKIHYKVTYNIYFTISLQCSIQPLEEKKYLIINFKFIYILVNVCTMKKKCNVLYFFKQKA